MQKKEYLSFKTVELERSTQKEPDSPTSKSHFTNNNSRPFLIVEYNLTHNQSRCE